MNYSLKKSMIPSSIFESNSFLINNETSLIEYAAFFGSVQIFQYLLLNNVELTPELWLYAIHGRNAEIIHMIEENHIQPDDRSYSDCLIESIKCHHNEIALYIRDNLHEKKNYMQKIKYYMIFNVDDIISVKIIKAFNIEFFSNVQVDPFNNRISSFIKNNYQILYVEYLLWENKEYNKSLILKIASHNENLLNIIEYILSTLDEIESFEFENSIIQKISIPNSIELIGIGAFYESEKLTEVIIPSSVIEIRNKAFCHCYSLQKIVLSPSIKFIDNYAFSQCISLKQIIIPSSVTHIGNYAFNKCKSLSFVSIPPSVISIGKCAFKLCLSLKQITIPSPLTKIGENAFNQSPLEYALIISSNESIENNVFPPQTCVIQIVLNHI